MDDASVQQDDMSQYTRSRKAGMRSIAQRGRSLPKGAAEGPRRMRDLKLIS